MRPARPSVLVLSGPNLALLGTRQPEIYGRETLEHHVDLARRRAAALGLSLEHRQSDHEGDLVRWVGDARGVVDALIVNAGALTHYSWALHDALSAFAGPVVEVHLSNPAGREPFRHHSVVAAASSGTIAGFGGLGYELAVEAIARLLGVDGSEATEAAGGAR
jgi:3-dehydroquinate dehydratase-2